MNQFDDLYFKRHVGESEELLFVCHRHPILIIDNLLLWCFFGVLLPVFFYLHNTFGLQSILTIGYFELYIVTIYLVLIYQVFDWYNDVWLITNRGIIDIEWKYFTGDVHYIDYSSIQGIEIQTDSIFDALLGKGNIHVHLESHETKFFLSDAVNPQGIVEYIQAVIDELKHGHMDDFDDRKPFELLLDTLTEMVREHLEKKGSPTDDDRLEEEKIKEALRYTSTVDLRNTIDRASPGLHD